MNILIVDDEQLVLEDSALTLSQIYTNANIMTAENYEQAISHANQSVDVAFLDIEMPGKSGIELAKELQKINSRINIIFLTAHSKYALDAYQLLASAYLLKPFNEKDVKKAMSALRYPIQDKVEVHCFGNFTVVYKGEEIAFHREKERELFAYLIAMEGESVSSEEICKVLWPEDTSDKKNYLWKIISDLRKDLSETGIDNVLSNHKNSYNIIRNEISCDYYNYLDGVTESWNGEFMSQYSGWVEEFRGRLFFDN